MNNLQLPEVTPSASAVVTRPSVKRRIDPIDAPARPLGTKRLALIAKRTNAASSTSDRHAERLAAGCVPAEVRGRQGSDGRRVHVGLRDRRGRAEARRQDHVREEVTP